MSSPAYLITPTLNISDSREIGVDAVITLSSTKPGNGVEQIRDGNLETYWQSDGAAPHIINIHFMEKKSISQICLYCDFSLDESYSARKINIRSGTLIHDLIDVLTIELNEPLGWVIIPLHDYHSTQLPLKAHLIQIRIMAMHQNGRDTHIRQLKIFGPRQFSETGAMLPLSLKSKEFMQYSMLR